MPVIGKNDGKVWCESLFYCHEAAVYFIIVSASLQLPPVSLRGQFNCQKRHPHSPRPSQPRGNNKVICLISTLAHSPFHRPCPQTEMNITCAMPIAACCYFIS
jgi:hypothetical protein